jgi:glycolate oxidase
MIATAPIRNWQPIIQNLETIVGSNGIISSREERSVYECDGLASYRELPGLVVLPKTTQEIVDIVKLCDRHNIPFVARGSGTGLSGGAMPTEDCLLIVTTRMNRILEVDIENQRVVVQPGVINAWVTQAVSGEGFYYAPDPSSQIICSIGGNIAENSGGVHCLKYGVTTNHVLGMKIVLPDGELIEVGSKIAETPGYDLTGLFVGSEGTLGIATEITLNITKTPEVVEVLLADFTDIEAAGKTVADIIAGGIIPAGMEIMDNLSIIAVENVVATNCYPRDAGAILLIELDGLGVEVEASCDRVQTICRSNGARNVTAAKDAEERMKFWKGRKAAFAAAGKMSPNYFVQDGVIPRTQLVSVLKEIEALSERSGYKILNVFHAGDGNLHPLVLYDDSIPGDFEKVEEIGGEILKLCVRAGGSISGEHGIGADKRCYMPEMFTPTDLDTMQFVRLAFNPKELANPGKVFPTPRTCGEAAHAHHHDSIEGIDLF